MKNLPLVKSLFISLVCLCFSFISHGQQDPLYSQYFNNPMLINPAFAGSLERLYLGVAYRSQWSGIEGGPVSFNFNTHTSLVDNRVGAGVVVVQDQTGTIKNNFYGGVASYRIKLPNYTYFSFGMQMGMARYATNTEGLNVFNPDPLFTPFSETKFNTGVGVLLNNDRYSVGFSVPQLLANTASLGGQPMKVYSQNYYLFGSYVINFSERIQFKPSTLMRFTSGSSPAIDINANVNFNRLYTAGVLVRNLNTFGLLLQGVYKNFRLGYVFEVPSKSSALNFNTSEVSLAISLDVLSHHNHSNTGF
jgi:type IX secretion system PorP/SprF family membrane protein